jgi:hypothetical protein
MAKQKRVNKSQMVRDFIKDHPNAVNREVSEALAKAGVKLTANHVANIRAKNKKSGRRRRRGKGTAAPAAAPAAAKRGVSIAELKAALNLLKVCEGLAAAREALAAAHEIKAMV